jgi:hypothetical protein
MLKHCTTYDRVQRLPRARGRRCGSHPRIGGAGSAAAWCVAALRTCVAYATCDGNVAATGWGQVAVWCCREVDNLAPADPECPDAVSPAARFADWIETHRAQTQTQTLNASFGRLSKLESALAMSRWTGE